MANDNNSGFRFLVDASSERQYALETKDGRPVLPLHVFPANKPLKAGEVIYAFDDEMEKNIRSGQGSISTEAYQITVKADSSKPNGIGYSLSIIPVTFNAKQYRDVSSGQMRTELTLVPPSAEDLQDTDFAVAGLPARFGAVDSRSLAGETIYSLPPHHPDGKATQARDAISRQTRSAPVKDTRGQFNQPAAPVQEKKMKYTDAQVEQALAKFTQDLTAEARAGRLDPVVGREKETKQALKILTRRKQGSFCITGDAGVGKTAMFSAVAQALVDQEKEMPHSLQGARVLQLDLTAMTAGSRYRGDFEERLKPIIDGLAEREGVLAGKKIIMAIDEIHSQIGSGSSEGSSGAGQMMKPFLTSKGISVMATTTDSEYRKYIEKDSALASRFEKLSIHGTDEKATLTILKTLWPLTKKHNSLTQDLTEEDLRYIITMTNRFAPQESQPRKGEKAMNMAAASAEFEGRTVVTRDDIIAAVAQMSKLSPEFLGQSDAQRMLEMESELPKKVRGQPAVKQVCDGLVGSRSGLNDPNQPQACFVFQGPTGTGKTELAKQLAEFLFGSQDALIKLDMSDYAEKHSVSRLTGAPPGYVGFEDAEPALTERVRKQPYCVLLLDEVEKAHPEVFNVLLPILNDGKMTDNQGHEVLFNNVILLMTTNLGAREAQAVAEGKNAFGLEKKAPTPEQVQADLEKIYAAARKGFFRPEVINRIEELGGFLTFIPLTPQVVSDIALSEVEKVSKRLSARDGADLGNVLLELSPAAMEQVSKQGYNPAMGARPLRKVVREKVSNALGKWIMNHRDEVKAFVAQEGAAKIVIDDIDNFNPRLVKATPAVTNDNAPATPTVKRATPKP